MWNSFIFLTFSQGTAHKNFGNKLIVIEIAKTNNEMISSVLSNILGWPGGNSTKQVRLIPMHASRHDAVTLAQPTQARCGLLTPSTNRRLVYNTTTVWAHFFFIFFFFFSLFLFLKNEWTTTDEVDKTDRSREMYLPTRRNTREQGNTSAFDRKLSLSNARKIDR